MTLAERFRKCMDGDKKVRPPFCHNFGPLPETLTRWQQEGAFKSSDEWFWRAGFEGEPDKQIGNWIQINGYLCPPFEQKVLEADSEAQIVIDAFGVKKKIMKTSSSIPQFMSWPVNSRETWQQIKGRLEPDAAGRFDADWKQQRNMVNASPLPNFIGGLPCGFFGAPRELLGVENQLVLFYDDPDLMHDILRQLTKLWLGLWRKIAGQARVDFVFIWEDMCYRNGPLISPDLFRQFLLPCYCELIEGLKQAGIKRFFVDTDGNCDQLIPLFVEGGVTGMLPFEIRAGMDILKVRRQYPELGIIGGIDKTIFAQGKSAVENQLRIIREMLKYGRYIPTFDHTVPPDVSWNQYLAFCLRLKELVYAAGE